MRFCTTAILSSLSLCLLGAFSPVTNAEEPGLKQTPDAIDRVLELIDTKREDFRVDQEALMTASRTSYKLPLFEKWFMHPLRIPFWERHIRDSFLTAKGDPCKTLSSATEIIGLNARRDLISPTPLSAYRAKSKMPDALKTAILKLDAAAEIPDASQVPPEVRESSAMLIFAAADAMQWRELALRKLSSVERQQLYDALLKGNPDDTDAQSGFEKDPRSASKCFEHHSKLDSLSKVDIQCLITAGIDLSAVFGAACADLSKTSITEKFSFKCKTRYGTIALCGGEDSVYKSGEHHLLIIDTSGNDTYECGGASGGADLPLGMIIDAAGNDYYSPVDSKPSFGTGVLGWGFLTDIAGNDRYAAAAACSQGCGIAGAGMLVDFAGDDSYSALSNSQGFGFFGAGILADAAGRDSYSIYCYGQGCGLTLGSGILIDIQGNDNYNANDTDIKFPSAQTSKHNCSMAQGAGCGDRRDYVDNQSLAGGIGILLDGAGDDTYFGGVFSQAVGYWYGIGILDDRSGNDSYRSVWYGQSATAHFGISYLNDGGGDDLYTSTNCVNVGAAHDFSASIFADEAGNDRYEGASNCGQALNNSVSLFVDMGGDDSYSGKSLGQSSTFSETGLRAELLTRAVFLDLGGNDRYPSGDFGNNKSWVQKNKKPLPLVSGAGLDCENIPLRWDIAPLTNR